ncbi:hypothetical protein LOK49_LG03G01637 [Camellia lanceoleosa]|uniref:Uncharacterized protein n=1 Tax=Camellia lanceoleosa TaxID=1840588 RepID=A0ACC0IAZ5_9ERIC|nr:hypothetical protein LOK49_LG03G01637 [Camellia lanceoleosa]
MGVTGKLGEAPLNLRNGAVFRSAVAAISLSMASSNSRGRLLRSEAEDLSKSVKFLDLIVKDKKKSGVLVLHLQIWQGLLVCGSAKDLLLLMFSAVCAGWDLCWSVHHVSSVLLHYDVVGRISAVANVLCYLAGFVGGIESEHGSAELEISRDFQYVKVSMKVRLVPCLWSAVGLLGCLLCCPGFTSPDLAGFVGGMESEHGSAELEICCLWLVQVSSIVGIHNWQQGCSDGKGSTRARQTMFVEELVKLMDIRDLELQNKHDNTVLCFVAASRNTRIAEVMMEKNSNLPTVRGNKGLTVIHMATLLGHRVMVLFLYSVTRVEDLTKEDFIGLLVATISSDLYDVALHNLIADQN